MRFDSEIAKKNNLVNASLKGVNQNYCMICYEEFSKTDSKKKPINLVCGHQFCKHDWEEYLKQRVALGF